MSKGGAMHVAIVDFIVNLNMFCWLSRSLALKTLDTKIFTPSTNRVLPEQNVVLITLKCFGKDVSQFSCNRYWGTQSQKHPWYHGLETSFLVFKSKFLQPLQHPQNHIITLKTKQNKMNSKQKWWKHFYSSQIKILATHALWHTPKHLIDSNVNLRWKQQKDMELGQAPWFAALLR